MDFKELIVYKKAFNLAMKIFNISKDFPKEEKCSLTDQIRRSSRSTCSNLAEAYRKRRYPKHFISKVTDSDSENYESGVWLYFAFSCLYIDEKTHSKLLSESEEVGKLLYHMILNPEKYGCKTEH